MEYFYRIEDHLYASFSDEYGESSFPPTVKLTVIKIPLIKRTPKGAWIGYTEGSKKFVLLTANKRYALPTMEEAKESFLARKKKQISIYESRVTHAKRAIALCEKGAL